MPTMYTVRQKFMYLLPVLLALVMAMTSQFGAPHAPTVETSGHPFVHAAHVQTNLSGVPSGHGHCSADHAWKATLSTDSYCFSRTAHTWSMVDTNSLDCAMVGLPHRPPIAI